MTRPVPGMTRPRSGMTRPRCGAGRASVRMDGSISRLIEKHIGRNRGIGGNPYFGVVAPAPDAGAFLRGTQGCARFTSEA